MEVFIPNQQREVIGGFLRLSQQARTGIVQAVRSVVNTRSLERFHREVVDRIDRSVNDRDEIVSAFMAMNVTRHREAESADTFASGFVTAAKALDLAPIESRDDERFWTHVSEQVANILSCPALDIVSKASHLARAHEREFLDALVVSDLRPVFRADTKLGPAAVMITHSLRIEHNGSGDNFEVVLMVQDLRTLKRIVERALAKEEALRAFAQNANIPLFVDSDEEAS